MAIPPHANTSQNPPGTTRKAAAGALLDDPLDLGFLLGVLVAGGSFGGDGRQPAITVRMHTKHEALFRRLVRLVPGSRLYGPYTHSGRSYFQWLVRGRALRRLVLELDAELSPTHDGHAFSRYAAMRTDYAAQLGPFRQGPENSPKGESRG